MYISLLLSVFDTIPVWTLILNHPFAVRDPLGSQNVSTDTVLVRTHERNVHGAPRKRTENVKIGKRT
jgi:hypothetical protein